jgi:NAD(P)-dependent dehydrogenase (short-subunit alcohol dehydrogenase family)
MVDLFDLRSRVAVITGGLGQLGLQFALTLAQRDVKVALLDIKTQRSNEKLSHYLSNGTVKIYECDITSKERVQECYDFILHDFGIPDILINNAALDSPPNASAKENGAFEEYPLSSLDEILNVNIKGPFICCQVFGKAMALKGKGRIINIASIYGVNSPVQEIYEYKRLKGELWYKPAAYGISKAALINLTKYLATYWAKRGVTVNAISPAGIYNNQDAEFLSEYTKRIPIGRMANENELNGAIVFLSSDASTYITGINLLIDGGWTSW